MKNFVQAKIYHSLRCKNHVEAQAFNSAAQKLQLRGLRKISPTAESKVSRFDVAGLSEGRKVGSYLAAFATFFNFVFKFRNSRNVKRIVLTFALLSLAVFSFAEKAKYVFLFIGDGMGVNVVNATEVYLGSVEGKIGITPMIFPSFPYMGVVTTHSANAFITDSSAAGTALSCGCKTNNSSMGVDINNQPVQNIAEKAQANGRKVAILTSVSIDHATPGTFYAHQPSRSYFYEIALDLTKSNFDFFGGGGFLRPTPKDKTPIWDVLDKAGYTVARGLQEYDTKAPTASKMLLIQPKGSKHVDFPYAIDQKPEDMNLADLTTRAVDFVTKDKSNKGFFMMVEGGMIDHAVHTNDGACAVKEVIDMDNAVKVAYEFYKKHPKETLIVVTADHNTGGIGVGNKTYRLQYQKCSVDVLSDEISKMAKSKKQVSWEEMKAFLKDKLGFWDKVRLDWSHEQRLYLEFGETFINKTEKYEKTLYARTHSFASLAKRILNERAGMLWSSTSHTGDVVPVYAIGVGAEKFTGRLDNTDIPKRIEQVAGY